MTIAGHIDDWTGLLRRYEEIGLLVEEQCDFLKAVALDTDWRDEDRLITLVWLLVMAMCRRSEDHIAKWVAESEKRLGTIPLMPPLDAGLAENFKELPKTLATQPDVIQALRKHAPLLDGPDSYFAITTLCDEAAELVEEETIRRGGADEPLLIHASEWLKDWIAREGTVA